MVGCYFSKISMFQQRIHLDTTLFLKKSFNLNITVLGASGFTF